MKDFEEKLIIRDNMDLLKQWDQSVPPPNKLEGDEKWNVFLSYRSVNRKWTLDLYDVLRAKGHKVFLDQVVLKAGDQLTSNLEKALTQSQAGVLIWSEKSADSEWVRREYETMEAIATRKKNFRFVPIRLDNSELPLFAANRIFLDFSAYPDGPNGGELLRLLHAIVGKALSDDAAKVSANLDEAAYQSTYKIKSAIQNGYPQDLIDLYQSGYPDWQTSASLPCLAADGLIKLGKNDDAIEMLSKIETQFAKAVRPKQLMALALARRGNENDLKKAQGLLGSLTVQGEEDPETLGIYGRTWMDRFNKTHNLNHLKKSRDLYYQAFTKAQDDYYTGINAAAKSVFIGEATDLKLATEIAENVQEIVGNTAIPGDYWMTATIGEVSLILRDFEKAGQMYESAVTTAPEETGSHKSTWAQACRLMEKLKPTDDERAMVRKAFAHLDDCPST